MAEVMKFRGPGKTELLPAYPDGRPPHAFQVEVALLAGSGGSKGGTVMGNPEEVLRRNVPTTFPVSTTSTRECRRRKPHPS